MRMFSGFLRGMARFLGMYAPRRVCRLISRGAPLQTDSGNYLKQFNCGVFVGIKR